MKLFHRHNEKIISATAYNVYYAGVEQCARKDTKVDLLCTECGRVRTKTFMGQVLSAGHIKEIAEIKGWKFDPEVFS